MSAILPCDCNDPDCRGFCPVVALCVEAMLDGCTCGGHYDAKGGAVAHDLGCALVWSFLDDDEASS